MLVAGYSEKTYYKRREIFICKQFANMAVPTHKVSLVYCKLFLPSGSTRGERVGQIMSKVSPSTVSVVFFLLGICFSVHVDIALCVIFIVWSVVQIRVVSPGWSLLLIHAAPLVEDNSRVGQAVVGSGRFKGRAVMPLDLQPVSDSAALTGQRLVHGHLGVNAVAVAVIIQAIVATQLAVIAQRRLAGCALLFIVTSQ